MVNLRIYSNRKKSGSGSGSGNAKFANDITVILSGGKSVGRYTNGQVIPAQGKTAEEVFGLIAQEYLVPTISSFSISGQATSVESGTSFPAGLKPFAWASTNTSNIVSGTLAVTDVTLGTTLATNLANDGAENINVPLYQLNGNVSKTFRLTANQLIGGPITRDFTINSYYRIFFGPTVSVPTNSAEARALPSSQLTNAGNTFILNTGTINSHFCFAIPSSKNLTIVTDLDAANATLTSAYTLTNITVNDTGGTPISYKLYSLTIVGTYSSNHRHQITIS